MQHFCLQRKKRGLERLESCPSPHSTLCHSSYLSSGLCSVYFLKERNMETRFWGLIIMQCFLTSHTCVHVSDVDERLLLCADELSIFDHVSELSCSFHGGSCMSKGEHMGTPMLSTYMVPLDNVAELSRKS